MTDAAVLAALTTTVVITLLRRFAVPPSSQTQAEKIEANTRALADHSHGFPPFDQMTPRQRAVWRRWGARITEGLQRPPQPVAEAEGQDDAS